jgi:hypothetical protein
VRKGGFFLIISVLAVTAGCSSGGGTSSGNGGGGIAPGHGSPKAVPSTIPPTSTTRTTTTRVSAEQAICAAYVPNGVSAGDHCGVTNLKVSTVDPNWVFAFVGIYNAQDQHENQESQVILNLSTHQTVVTENGFCGKGGEGSGTGTPIAGYSSVPANVLAGFGLRPCSPSPGLTAAVLAPFVGTWGAHSTFVSNLVISTTGTGHLSYGDLTLCPSCCVACAPVSTLLFVLTSGTNGDVMGSITASSDPKNYTVGEAVELVLTAGSPGQLLEVKSTGRSTLFCNSTSAGQCGQ